MYALEVNASAETDKANVLDVPVTGYSVSCEPPAVCVTYPPWLASYGYPINGNIVLTVIGIKIANICINGSNNIINYVDCRIGAYVYSRREKLLIKLKRVIDVCFRIALSPLVTSQWLPITRLHQPNLYT